MQFQQQSKFQSLCSVILSASYYLIQLSLSLIPDGTVLGSRKSFPRPGNLFLQVREGFLRLGTGFDEWQLKKKDFLDLSLVMVGSLLTVGYEDHFQG